MHIGAKIKKIRSARGMTQAKLGELVNLTGDRIQKYENGVRTPKKELIASLANALDVSTFALTGPIISEKFSVMHLLFEMEEVFDLKTKEIDGKIFFYFDDSETTNSLSHYLRKWHEQRVLAESALNTAKDNKTKEALTKNYNFWKWTFPN